MSLAVVSILLLGSAFAGWVDAVVGGGGLILIPLVLITNPAFSNAEALGINKIASICGTTSSAITLGLKVPSAKKALLYSPLSIIAAGLGALFTSYIDKNLMRIVLIVLLVAVAIFIMLRPYFGQESFKNRRRKHAPLWIALTVIVLSLYDGAFGPGTGVFLILTLTSILQENFLISAAWAKIINVFANLGALIVFACNGQLLWSLGILLAIVNVIGAQIGARMVLVRGSGFVRIILLLVVLVLTTKLAFDQFGFFAS